MPRLTSAVGGATGATFGLTTVPTAVKYIVTASRDGTDLQPARHEGEGAGRAWMRMRRTGGPAYQNCSKPLMRPFGTRLGVLRWSAQHHHQTPEHPLLLAPPCLPAGP